jgi:formylglycine-generating enzyme required for sulfatase activity
MPTSPPVGDERVGASRKVRLIAGLVALACIVAAGVGIFTMRGPSPSAPPATPVASAAPSPTPTPVASTPSPSPTPPARSGACDGSGVALALLASRTPAVLSVAEECALKPKDVFRECADCPPMVVVPAGSFTMGSPGTGPQHDVRIAKPFAVGKIQVTVDEFSTFVSATNYDAGSACTIWNGKSWESTSGRSWRDPGFAQTGSHPATCLNWNDAQAYARWLAGRTSKNYRLPSEAEWEYAARGRTEPGAYPRYFFGDSEADFCEYGNGADETALKQIPGAKDWSSLPCVDGYAYTSPVGSFKPNAFGLYDMAGNVSQWLEDCDHENYDEAPSDGSAWITGSCRFRVLRGGSWNSGPAGLRPAARYAIPPSIRRSDTGFRLARTLNN